MLVFKKSRQAYWFTYVDISQTKCEEGGLQVGVRMVQGKDPVLPQGKGCSAPLEVDCAGRKSGMQGIIMKHLKGRV